MKANFHITLSNWYSVNKRDLPWRETSDPYVIWLSEIILQQTRVSQGLPYFERFVERFPTVKSLAEAEEQDILKLWQGLGYYSRARNLHAAAKAVIKDFEGKFPNSYNELIKLKGVGVYTASAVASFSSNEAVAVVDGNVYRVLSRLFGVYTPINSTEGIKEYKKLADSLLAQDEPAIHNQAIMEFGALACTPKKPACEECPFSGDCYANLNNVVDQLPVKIKKVKVRKRYFTFVLVKKGNSIFLEKRNDKDIWRHMYQLPLIESEVSLTSAKAKNEIEKLGFKVNDLKLISSLKKPHKLSHQHIYADFYEIKINDSDEVDTCYQDIPFKNVKDYPVPVLISNFLESYFF